MLNSSPSENTQNNSHGETQAHCHEIQEGVSNFNFKKAVYSPPMSKKFRSQNDGGSKQYVTSSPENPPLEAPHSITPSKDIFVPPVSRNSGQNYSPATRAGNLWLSHHHVEKVPRPLTQREMAGEPQLLRSGSSSSSTNGRNKPSPLLPFQSTNSSSVVSTQPLPTRPEKSPPPSTSLLEDHLNELTTDGEKGEKLHTYRLTQWPEYNKWFSTRNCGFVHPRIINYFDRKTDSSPQWKKRTRSKDSEVVKYNYDRFLRYAVDIDEGVDYLGCFQKKCDRNPLYPCYFLDIGFAPGGMSTLLLKSAPNARGIGITLGTENGGYSVPENLLNHPKFSCIEMDVEKLAVLYKYEARKAMGLSERFEGFDFVICAVTPFTDPTKSKLEREYLWVNKWRLLYAQLIMAFTFLREGALVLLRHKLSYRVADIQLLYNLIPRFSGYVCTKPRSQFVIRRTFWTLWMGWRGESEKEAAETMEFVRKMKDLLKRPLKETTVQHVNECIVTCKIPEMWVKITCARVRPILKPMIEEQIRALEQFMDGKSDQMCKRNYCSQRKCSRAHSEDDLISGVQKAHEAINRRLKELNIVSSRALSSHSPHSMGKQTFPKRGSDSLNWRTKSNKLS